MRERKAMGTVEGSGTAHVYRDEVGIGAVTSFGGGGGGRSWKAGGGESGLSSLLIKGVDESSHGLSPFCRWCEVNRKLPQEIGTSGLQEVWGDKEYCLAALRHAHESEPGDEN